MNRNDTKTRRPVLRVIALALAMTLVLSGCTDIRRLILSRLRGSDGDMVPFGRMVYQRPDMDALEELFTSATDFAQTASAKDGDALTRQLNECWDAYDGFYTMETLAELHADIDQTDEKWADEYDFCQGSEVKIEAWLDQLLTACAASRAPVSRNLLAGYDQRTDLRYSARALELKDRENSLLRDYYRVMQLDEIELNGKTVSYLDTISDPAISDEDYRAAQLAYYRACNAAAAPIYIDLIKTRRELAAELGFDSYEAYQFAVFGRDYTPEQVRAYLDDVAGMAADYYRSFMAMDPASLISYGSLSQRKLVNLLGDATAEMGKTVTDAYAFMTQYDLYDVAASVKKAPGAYTVYLDSYDAPFCYVGAYGDVEDFLDFAHEFGHFVDAYHNYNTTTSLDLSETYSQALANLALLKSRELLSDGGYRDLLLIHLQSNLAIYAEQSAYADFESRVFALPDGELTVENLNALALECSLRFGADATAGAEDCPYYWTQVTHLFDYPFYVISYCVSADAAVQILEREMENPGDGAAIYDALLDWKEDAFLSELERVGLESPFAPGRADHNLALVESIMRTELSDLPNAA
ncbi:MAG: hypothetical protein II458_08030 [Oscillospiraceae bacterium]|nr:hypothetical protein [Oscillospiraceae bacterium]